MPRICDFGLAKLLDQAPEETRSGVQIGSPEYMAPEQASGRIREHGLATDVYALGVILYELLTGRPPHRGETDLETIRLVSDQDPQSPRTMRPGLPRDLETIVLKCLEKPPARRYARASELVEDLERFLGGRPVKARPVPMWERASKWAGRRPVHAALLLVLGLSVPAILGGVMWARQNNSELRTALDRSRRSETEVRGQRDLIDRENLNLRRDNFVKGMQRAGSFAQSGEFEAARTILDGLLPPHGQHDSRGFSWLYLDRLVHPHVELLPSLPQTVVNLAHSADGRMIAMTSAVDNRTFLLDRETQALRPLGGEPRLPHCLRLAFSPDGRTLASLSHGITAASWLKREVKVWDVATGAEIDGMTDRFGLCYQVVFSPDGENLVTVEATAGGNTESPVRVWRLSDDRKRLTLRESLRADELKPRLQKRDRTGVASGESFQLADILAVSPDDGATMAVSLETGEIFLYDAGTAYCRAVCHVAGSEAVFVPRTNLFTPYRPAELSDIERQVRSLTLRAKSRSISANIPIVWARFSSDGRVAAAFGRPQDQRFILRVIDVATGRLENIPRGGDVTDKVQFEFTPRGDALVVTQLGTRAQVWERPVWRLPGHEKEVWGLVFSPDGRTLISSSDDHTIKLWDVASGRARQTLKGHESLVTAVALSPAGDLLASAGWDKTVRLWQVSSGAAIATFVGHRDHVRAIAFSLDGKTVASGGNDQEIRLWDLASMRQRNGPLIGHDRCISALAFAKGGKTLFSGAADNTIKRRDWETGRLLETWNAGESVTALAFAPDAETLAAAQDNGPVSLWSLAERRVRSELRGHTGRVNAVAFSPDGLTLASAGRDKTVRLWDPLAAQELLTLRGHDGPVGGLAFSPDGTILATGGFDGAIKLWRGSPRTTGSEENRKVTSHSPAQRTAPRAN